MSQLYRPFRAHEDVARLSEENRAPRREGNLASVSPQKWKSNLPLEIPDLTAHARLRYVELAGRDGEVPVLGDGAEIPEMAKLHWEKATTYKL